MKKFLFLVFISLLATSVSAQESGKVAIVKDPLIDTLIAKRIALNKVKATVTNPATKTIVSSLGYRVQVFYGLDRREAFNQQSKFKGMFPKTNAYITYKEPNYYLRVGDFRTRLEAQKFLNELKPNFPTLFIFREKINAPDLDND